MQTLDQIRQQLEARRGDWALICRQTRLAYNWLTKFADGRISEPGYGKIVRLVAYFDENPLPQAQAEAA